LPDAHDPPSAVIDDGSDLMFFTHGCIISYR
jgi:hypothetical protein